MGLLHLLQCQLDEAIDRLPGLLCLVDPCVLSNHWHPLLQISSSCHMLHLHSRYTSDSDANDTEPSRSPLSSTGSVRLCVHGSELALLLRPAHFYHNSTDSLYDALFFHWPSHLLPKVDGYAHFDNLLVGFLNILQFALECNGYCLHLSVTD